MRWISVSVFHSTISIFVVAVAVTTLAHRATAFNSRVLDADRRPDEDTREIEMDTKNAPESDVCHDPVTRKSYPEGEVWALPGCRRGKCIVDGLDRNETIMQISECHPPKVKPGCKSHSGKTSFPFPLCCVTVSCEVSSHGKLK